MGIYLNPGNQGFRESIRSRIYVDKTNLIACTNALLNTNDKYICVSRPRRFGKSMALQMLAAYYGSGCDSGELFAGLKGMALRGRKRLFPIRKSCGNSRMP